MDNNRTYSSTVDKSSQFQMLLDSITEKRMQPEDVYEIAALVESMGWTDDRVADTFGVTDVFELASDLWNAMSKKALYTPFDNVEGEKFIHKLKDTVRSFLRGLIFALPMVISVFSMLAFTFSLWSYENLSLETATAIAIGTILSFLTVGGFTQSIARRGFLYIIQDYYNMARRITMVFIRIGYLLTFVIAILFFVFNLFFEMFSIRMMLIIVLYYFFLTTIWLSVTVMYILRSELAFTGLLVAGIALVGLLFFYFKLDIIVAQLISLVFVAVLGMIIVVYIFKRAEQRMEKGIAPSLPRMSITLYSVMPYFVYGFFYFLFLYMDRVIAWSTNNTGYMPYIIWFRGPYELGLDFALFTLILPMGLIEVLVSRLLNNLETSQKFASINDTPELSRKYHGIFVKRLILTLIIALISAVVVYFVAKLLDSGFLTNRNTGFLNNYVTNFVFIVSLASYSFLCVGLMNAIILFSLSQPEMVNKSILPAIIANLVIGFLLSRWIDYYFAIFGLLAGSIIFSLLVTQKVLKVLRNLDYYLYAVI